MLVELRLSKRTSWGGAEGADGREEEEGDGQTGWIMEDRTTDLLDCRDNVVICYRNRGDFPTIGSYPFNLFYHYVLEKTAVNC